MGLNEDFFEDDDVALTMLLETEYCIPLFWLALFRADDIRLYHAIPILLTSRAQALANIDQRAGGLAALLGEPGDKLIAQLRTFIEQNEYAHYLLNTSELAQMEDSEGEFLADLTGWFSDMEAIAKGAIQDRSLKVLAQADPELAEFPYVGRPFHLCGHSFNLSLPWETQNV